MRKSTIRSSSRVRRQPQLPGFAQFKRFQGGVEKRKDGHGFKSSHPKVARPFSPKLSQHVVLKSSKAVRKHSFLLHGRSIEKILTKHADRLQIKVHNIANSGNHLHLFFRAYTRASFRAYMKTISGLIARKVIGSKKGKPSSKMLTQFWDARPYSRVVSDGPEFINVKKYLVLNSTETGLGLDRRAARAMLDQAYAFLRSPNLVSIGFG